MLKLIRYATQFDTEMQSVDSDMFLEAKYHKDVLSDSIILVLDTKKGKQGSVIGFGYLLASASYRLIARELPEYHIHAIQKASGPSEAEASIMLLNALMDLFLEQQEAHPDKHLVLRLWARETASEYLGLLRELGFHQKDMMYIYENQLEKNRDKLTLPFIFQKAEKNLPGLLIKKVTPDDAYFRDYLRVNEEAFHIPDSLDDLVFKLRYNDGSLYSAFLKDRLIASLTSFRINETVYTTENIFCMPAFQNQGAVRALLGFVLLRLKKEGRLAAALSVYSNDLPAIRLYSSYGYQRKHTLLEMQYTARDPS